MSVRQYIGARYVMKIYENTLDPSSAEWQASVNYEPLTMVTYNNGSYLSKKQVPASVGDPASNPDYWAQNGSYNGQIASLQNQINAINDKLPGLDMNTRRMIIISDSYGSRTDSDGNTIFDLIKSKLSLSDDDFFHGNLSGAGFTNSDPVYTFLSILQNINASDADTITDIAVIGGANDWSKSRTDIYNAINAFCSYVKTNYKNATVTLFACGMTLESSYFNDWFGGPLKAYKGVSNFGGQYINNSEYVLCNSELLEADHCHPNTSGVPVIAESFIQGLLTGSVDVCYRIYNPTLTISNGTISSAILLTGNNGCFKSYGSSGLAYDIVINFTSPLTASAGDMITTITFDKYLCPGVKYGGIAINRNIIAIDNANNHIPLALIMYGNTISIYTGTNLSNVTSLSILNLVDVTL